MLDRPAKIALVTGSSRGIGAGIAKRLARDGIGVAVNYARDLAAAERVVGAIRSAGGTAISLQADLTDPAQIPSLIDETIQQLGRLDILVNNAGWAQNGTPLDQITLDHYHRQFDLNVRGVLLVTKAASPHVSDGGRIINITSGITRSPTAGSSVYGATKAAVEWITKCLAKELAPRQITVNAVAPGITDTDLLWQAMPKENAEMLKSMTPLGRLGTVEDVADVVAFVASDQARWITGEIIGATGGL